MTGFWSTTGGGGGNDTDSLPSSATHRWQYASGSGSTAADSIGSLDGTVSNATWVSGTWQDGYALDLDSANDGHVGIPYSSDFDVQTFSIFATVELDTLSSSQYRVVDYFSGGNNEGYQFNCQDGSGNNVIEWLIHNGSGVESVTGSTALTTGTKYRVGVTVNSGAATLYLNTATDGSAPLSNFNTTGGSLDWWHGANQQGGSALDGRIDDVVFYNDELSSSGIQSDYDAQPWT